MHHYKDPVIEHCRIFKLKEENSILLNIQISTNNAMQLLCLENSLNEYWHLLRRMATESVAESAKMDGLKSFEYHLGQQEKRINTILLLKSLRDALRKAMKEDLAVETTSIVDMEGYQLGYIAKESLKKENNPHFHL
jgi:GH24 family phage-related lysozyme (muramidase)